MIEKKKNAHPHDKELPTKILTYLTNHPAATREEIGEAFKTPASTISRHIDLLKRKNRLIEGFTVTDEGKKDLIKCYIFIETQYEGPRPDDEREIPYQQELVKRMSAKLAENRHRETIFLESVEIVMGADFDIIVVLRAGSVYPVGDFVTGFLRTHRDVLRTKTIVVWPLQENSEDAPAESINGVKHSEKEIAVDVETQV